VKVLSKGIMLCGMFFSLSLFSEEEIVDMESIDKECLMNIVRQKNPPSPRKRKLKSKGLLKELVDPFPYRYPVRFTHNLVGSSLPRHTVILEDGSTWKIKSSDMHKVMRWKICMGRKHLSSHEILEKFCAEEVEINPEGQFEPDYLMITQNTSWFSDGLLIVNCTKGECVEAWLEVGGGPVIDGMYTNTIDKIDKKDENLVYLRSPEKNSVWDLCESDFLTYKSWAVNDSVIIGFNSGLAYEYPYILFNANLQNWVRVKPHIK
jgi:hypothetical protein